MRIWGTQQPDRPKIIGWVAFSITLIEFCEKLRIFFIAIYNNQYHQNDRLFNLRKYILTFTNCNVFRNHKPHNF